ncbi:hypothetical protein [Amycolatopsis sp. NPDC004378]
MTEDYAALPLPELEALLRGGDLPPGRRQAVEAELNRRYAEKWTSATPPPGPTTGPPPGPPPPGPPPPGPPLPGPSTTQPYPPPGPPPPRAAWGPPPAAVPPPKTAGLAKPLGCLAAFLVAAVLAVVVVLVVDGGSSSPPPQRIGTVCVTQRVTCPMGESLPVGQSCVCPTSEGDYVGVVA